MKLLDLDAIRARCDAADVPALLAYVHDLEQELAELMRVNKGVARHGIITESVRQLTELLGIERQNPSANETTDAAAVEIKRLRAALLFKQGVVL